MQTGTHRLGGRQQVTTQKANLAARIQIHSTFHVFDLPCFDIVFERKEKYVHVRACVFTFTLYLALKSHSSSKVRPCLHLSMLFDNFEG